MPRCVPSLRLRKTRVIAPFCFEKWARARFFYLEGAHYFLGSAFRTPGFPERS